MIRRLLAAALAGGLTLAGASIAVAAPPHPDPGCTFEKGKTSCVQTTSHLEFEGSGEPCEGTDPTTGEPKTGVVGALVLVTERTVTVYKANRTDSAPISSQTEVTREVVDPSYCNVR